MKLSVIIEISDLDEINAEDIAKALARAGHAPEKVTIEVPLYSKARTILDTWVYDEPYKDD